MQGLSMENVNYVNNFKGQQNHVYGNTYNPSWRNHPNFSWSNQGNSQWKQQAPPGFGNQNAQHHQSQFHQDKGSSSGVSLESKLEKFMDVMSAKMNQQDETSKRFEKMFKNHSFSIYNLEIHMGQLANSLSLRNQGLFPSNTEKNPKEQLKAITLRSGT